MSANADFERPCVTCFVDSKGRAVLLPTRSARCAAPELLVDVEHAETFAMARHMCGALRAGDWAAISQLLAGSVTWLWPAGNAYCEFRGVAQVIVHFRRVARSGMAYRSADMLVSRDGFVLHLRQTAACERLPRARSVALVCRTADRQIHAITTYAGPEDGARS